jgi:xanthine/CO dehydrogenase XdhC/CoxF family maturation factor
MERVRPGQAEILDLIREVRATRRPAKVAHVLQPESEVGWHVYDSSEFEAPGREVFVETLSPPVRLLIFGAGDDAVPLTEGAKSLGWEVFVFDGRSHYARREKFPKADQVTVRSAGALLPSVDPWTVAVLMSHSYSQDLEGLRELAHLPFPYLGILGPNKRTLQLLADAGLERNQTAAKVRAPMGLDIGADGPEQVALSVIAEIQAVLNGREGGTLSTREGSIHAREGDPALVWTRSIVCA